ncbi:MAG TPA: acyl carrier protein [Streptosporangiaceae bacterium]|nr:acyl carrier protein [Streptosporangiaceae bacterium]
MSPARPAPAAIADELRRVLAAATGRPELARLTLDTPLFGDRVGLDSLTGTLLLRQVRQRFGVDVAAEDLNLDSLATVRTLAEFVAARAALAGGAGPGAGGCPPSPPPVRSGDRGVPGGRAPGLAERDRGVPGGRRPGLTQGGAC